MKICDRHTEQPAQSATTVFISDTEGYDLCMSCLTEFQEWIHTNPKETKEEPKEPPKRGRPAKK